MRQKRRKKNSRFILLSALIILIAVIAGFAIFGKNSNQNVLQGEDQGLPEQKQDYEYSIELTQNALPGKTEPIDTVSNNILILINKEYALADNYWPDDMIEIDRHVEGVGSQYTHQLRKVAADALNEMFDAAAEEGIELRLRTGFRSYSYQSSLYNSYVEQNGKGAADTYSARPGYSEHQTGLACDLGGATENFALSYNFGNTKEGQWVAQHAHEYGYIIRYTDGYTDESGVRRPGEITGYVFEPWHIRYVGKYNAEKIKEAGITLEEYILGRQ